MSNSYMYIDLLFIYNLTKEGRTSPSSYPKEITKCDFFLIGF